MEIKNVFLINSGTVEKKGNSLLIRKEDVEGEEFMYLTLETIKAIAKYFE